MGFGRTPMLRTRSILVLVALLAILGSCRFFGNNDDPVGPADDSGQGDDYVDPCPDGYICPLGDLNQNGLAYEIADYFTLKNYFLIGEAAFPEGKVEEAIANGDINRDGTSCTAADLVCMYLMIAGYDLPKPGTPPVSGDLRLCDGVVSSPHYPLGAAAFVVKGEVTPVLLTGRATMEYAFDGTNTRVVLYDVNTAWFLDDLVNLGGELVSADFGASNGVRIPAVLHPTEVVLEQNYPNPFTTTATISFEFPNGGSWQIDIRGWNGQKAAQLSGNSPCGVENVIWDGGNLPSGTYYYTLNAGGKSLTKIATLSK